VVRPLQNQAKVIAWVESHGGTWETEWRGPWLLDRSGFRSDLFDRIVTIEVENGDFGDPDADQSIELLLKLSELRKLSLCGVPITDKSVATIKQLKQLESLVLLDTRLSPESMKELGNDMSQLSIGCIRRSRWAIALGQWGGVSRGSVENRFVLPRGFLHRQQLLTVQNQSVLQSSNTLSDTFAEETILRGQSILKMFACFGGRSSGSSPTKIVLEQGSKIEIDGLLYWDGFVLQIELLANAKPLEKQTPMVLSMPSSLAESSILI